MSAPKYCDDPDNCGYADCPTAFCDRNASTHSLQRVVLPPCEWEGRDGKKCGMPSKYELGFPDESKVMLCSLHHSRASTLGWPTRKRQNVKISDQTVENQKL